MGEFFNQEIRDMPNSEVRKLKKSVKVSDNRIYGQTKGYLEESRKAHNEEHPGTTERQEQPIDLLRQKRYDNLVKAREAKRLKAEQLKAEKKQPEHIDV
ncbi:hypothetical protein LCGC14_1805270 [marine sediment metagenome]|uniref:Uncharacterized protein n=1 Tax=marine sediment metagenome TaxID=412755 RepID=A0A0F9GNB8_9ZZZZ